MVVCLSVSVDLLVHREGGKIGPCLLDAWMLVCLIANPFTDCVPSYMVVCLRVYYIGKLAWESFHCGTPHTLLTKSRRYLHAEI